MIKRKKEMIPTLILSLQFLLSCAGVQSFTFRLTAKARHGLHMSGDEPSFFDKIQIPFKSQPQETLPIEDEPADLPSESLSDVLIGKAKTVIASDLGLLDADLLDKDFIWIGPLLDKPLGKIDYLAAGKFFNIRSSFPDLDYRAHDFRVDANDPQTIRCTVRPVGAMRGALQLRSETVEANGKQWRGPPEAISMTFDESSGKLVKLCSEFVLDRFVGNTNGLCGVKAAATVAGVPPPAWEVYPITAVLSKFFGRPTPAFEEPSNFLAPFPDTVMIQLAKGVISADLAVEDSSLLSEDFTFATPLLGPVQKDKFLEAYAAQEFGGFEPEFSNFRVDPYDPCRVWVDVKPVGPGLNGPPQAFSFAFDEDGSCTRITAGAVMDPSIGRFLSASLFAIVVLSNSILTFLKGNTGGLTGPEGIKYALGDGAPDLATRPLPVAIGRLKKNILSPITKINVDDYILKSSTTETTKASSETTPTSPKSSPVESEAPPSGNVALRQKLEAIKKVAAEAEERKVSEAKAKAEAARKQEEIRRAEADQKRQEVEAKKLAQAEARKKLAQEREAASEQKRKVVQQKRAGLDQSTSKAPAIANPFSFPQFDLSPAKAPTKTVPKKKVAAKAPKGMSPFRPSKPSRAGAPESKAVAAARRKQAAAEQKRREAEQRKATQTAALAEAAKKQAEARKAAVQQKQQEARARMIAQAEARKKLAEERRAAAEQKKKEAEIKRAADLEKLRKSNVEAQRRKAEELKQKQRNAVAKKKVTVQQKKIAPKTSPSIKAPAMVNPFSLPQLNLSQPKAPKNASATKKISRRPPKGVPVIVAWKARPDGKVIKEDIESSCYFVRTSLCECFMPRFVHKVA